MSEKSFDLGTILTITSGKLLTRVDNVYEVLSFLYGYDITTGEISQLMSEAQAYVLERYPQLNGVGASVEIKTWEDVDMFIKDQKAIYGDSFSLTAMSKEISHLGRNR